MKLRTLIIDDEPIALEKLGNYVAKVPFLELVASCRGGLEALDYLASHEVDLVFTDINMPDLSGMDFVRSLTRVPMIVFTTAYQEYAVDSYRLSAVDYLLKPYGFADFQRAANKALELYRSRMSEGSAPSSGGPLFVKTDYRYVRVVPDEIRYVKGYGEYLQIFLTGQEQPLVTLSSFAAIRERLPGQFLQVHRSYIVNMDRIEQVERARIIMDRDTYIPVGESYKADFQQYLLTHSIGKTQKG